MTMKEIKKGKKRNNPSWCCDEIEKLIAEYKKCLERTYSEEAYLIYSTIIDELEEILYG